jgi:hypothetical protein
MGPIGVLAVHCLSHRQLSFSPSITPSPCQPPFSPIDSCLSRRRPPFSLSHKDVHIARPTRRTTSSLRKPKRYCWACSSGGCGRACRNLVQHFRIVCVYEGTRLRSHIYPEEFIFNTLLLLYTLVDAGQWGVSQQQDAAYTSVLLCSNKPINQYFQYIYIPIPTHPVVPSFFITYSPAPSLFITSPGVPALFTTYSPVPSLSITPSPVPSLFTTYPSRSFPTPNSPPNANKH